MKKIIAIAIPFFIIFLLYVYAASALHFADPSGRRVAISIPSGASAGSVARLLNKKGLIKNAFFFKLYVWKEGLSTKIKSGRYIIPPNSNLKTLVDLVTTGRTAEIPFTIPEGFTLDDIGSLLEKQELGTKNNFLKCARDCSFKNFAFLPKGSLEGYLFPDTYFVNPATHTNQEFVTRLLNTFRKRFIDAEAETIRKSTYTLNQIVIMASIVEAEERTNENRATVAGILWKRYNNKIGLGADATLRYGLNKKDREPLTADDLKSHSSYNTRKYRDLPPTPINNPGLASLRAALYPKESEYWYYLHGRDGVIHYAKTLEEHNENKRRYL